MARRRAGFFLLQMYNRPLQEERPVAWLISDSLTWTVAVIVEVCVMVPLVAVTVTV